MQKNYVLTPANVDVISYVVNKYMLELRMPHKEIIRGCPVVETVLLGWLQKAPQGTVLVDG